MFKFDFDLDNEFAELSVPSTKGPEEETPIDLQPFTEIQISQLVRPILFSSSCFYGV
jgi:hypothetical protein